ncbi:F-box protein [Phanerochaete sordida]|uniref:F-box protein n=1 Tax=Phanerochaete sordida TaxID=48140 RepID=A0A9P3LMJ8_9APHY|nr:F-box protein [Phanerochaete sordida]
MAMFMDLPSEVCENILLNLGPVLIVRFQRVCRAARALVRASVKLQYILACFRAGVVDCPSGTRFTTAEKLHRVRQWHAAWKRPTPDLRQETILRPKNGAFTIFQTSGPVFAQGLAPSVNEIEFYLPGSPLRNIQPQSWILSELPRHETFSFEWYLDLLVLVQRSNDQVTLYFLSCTSGAPHPLASKLSVSLALEDTDDTFSTFHLVISGDLILCQLRDRRDPGGEKWVLNWRQGSVLLNLTTPLDPMSWDCAILDSQYLLLTFGGVDDDDWKPHVLAIFDCHSPPRGKRLSIPDDLNFAVLSLQLPLLDANHQYVASWRPQCLSSSFEALPERIDGLTFRAMAPPRCACMCRGYRRPVHSKREAARPLDPRVAPHTVGGALAWRAFSAPSAVADICTVLQARLYRTRVWGGPRPQIRDDHSA